MSIKHEIYTENENFQNLNNIKTILTYIVNLLINLINKISKSNNTQEYNLPYYDHVKHDNSNIFLQHNDIDKGLNIINYNPRFDGRQCWNCGNLNTHSCCVACKRTSGYCECVYICSLSSPCQYNKYGEPTQFKKCKYYTSNIDNINHKCEGLTNDKVVEFDTRDSRSYSYHNV